MLAHHAPLPQLPAAARRMLDDNSPASAASPDFELVHWNAATSVPSFSDSLQKRSFRDVLTASTVTPLQQKEADLASFTLLSLPLPPLMRDASTSTTPTSSVHSSSEMSDSDDEEDSEERFAWEEEDQLELDDESLDFFPSAESSADLEDSSASSQLLPLDLCSHCTEVDYDALEAEGASTSDASLLSSPAAVDPFLLPRFRVRHRLLSHKPGSAKIPQYSRQYDDMQPTKGLHFYQQRSNKAGSGIAHLQKASRRDPVVAPTPVVSTVAAATPTPAPASGAPVPNPYEGVAAAARRAKSKAKKERAEALAASGCKPLPHHSNGKDGGEHQQARAQTHNQRHSLAALTRPALKSASSASFREILRERAERKVQLVQAAAAVPARLPKHLRPFSAAVAKKPKKKSPSPASASASSATPAPAFVVPAPQPRKDVSTVDARDFNSFRKAFFMKHRDMLESALERSCYGHRVAAVRLAPVGSDARARFMQKLRELAPSEAEVPCVYHGTRLQNMDSICARGLLVPNPGVNGVGVANGSALGLGIYTCREASYPFGYAQSTTTTLFVCAAITKGAVTPSVSRAAPAGSPTVPAVVSGDVVVLMEESRVCPLFLLDFDTGRTAASSSMSFSRQPTLPTNEPPTIRRQVARDLLAKAHAQLRKACSNNAKVHKHPAAVLHAL